ncbi:MAG TPA: hypothetical protein VF168_08835 [Trueperaceae bacterium]
MMELVRPGKLLRFLLPLGLIVSAPALATQVSGDVSHVRFAWSTVGQPAAIGLPLPGGVSPEEVESVVLPGESRLDGVSLHADPPRLEIFARPVPGGTLTFSAVELGLASGELRRFAFGRAAVLQLERANGPLRFERSLVANAAGIHGAVAVRNTGEQPLTLQVVRYLPDPLPMAHLLVATGDPGELLSELEAATSPALRREAGRSRQDYPQVEGFERRPASDLGLELAPGEGAVLVWTDASLPASSSRTSFELEPVIEYRSTAGFWQLGLPVTVRRYP